MHTFELILEQFISHHPAHITIQLDKNRKIKITAISNLIVERATIDHEYLANRIKEAIKLLKWAILNDPEPQQPNIINFMKTI